MAWLTSIKGAHPGLIQSDKTLEATDASIERGTIMAVEDGKFVPATTDGAGASGLLYISLQDYWDAQAGMAGESAMEPGGAPAVSGVSMSMSGEYETSNFDFSDGAPLVGEGLAARNGVLVKASSSADAVAVLTSPAKSRWVNDAPAKTVGQVVRQGANVKVIRYIPVKAAAEAPAPVLGPLCFTAQEDGSTVKLDKSGSPADISLEYSTDGETWDAYTIGTTITLARVGDFVKLRGNNSSFSSDDSNYYGFSMTGKIAASGSVTTLLDKTGSLRDLTGYAYCCTNMFSACSSLTEAPELPATTLAEGCYSEMFSACSSLTEAPELPAATLAEDCYRDMFNSCSRLTKAPELPATTMAPNCYNSMFIACSSLTEAPELPATTLAEGCYQKMFSACSSLTEAPELPATTLEQNCYNTMFAGSSHLNYMNVSFTSWSPENATTSWLGGVSATGEFHGPYDLVGEDPKTGASFVPSGWTVVVEGDIPPPPPVPA